MHQQDSGEQRKGDQGFAPPVQVQLSTRCKWRPSLREEILSSLSTGDNQTICAFVSSCAVYSLHVQFTSQCKCLPPLREGFKDTHHDQDASTQLYLMLRIMKFPKIAYKTDGAVLIDLRRLDLNRHKVELLTLEKGLLSELA